MGRSGAGSNPVCARVILNHFATHYIACERYAELFSALFSQTSRPATLICPTPHPATRARLIQALSSWSFDPHSLPPDELMIATCLIFQTVLIVDGMMEDCNVTHGQKFP
jgi:hypothetical protein